MKVLLKNAILPHEGNDYTPHLLRQSGVVVVMILSLLIIGVGFISRSVFFSDTLIGTIYPEVVTLLSNEERGKAHLGNLKVSTELTLAAEKKAEDMISRGYFAHFTPDGRAPWDFIKESGYEYEYAGENLAINFSESEDVTEAWMNSPTHRANILNNHYTEIGVAAIKGKVDGKESVFVVQMFGSPKSKSFSKAIAEAILPKEQKEESLKATSTPLVVSEERAEALASSTEVLGLATTEEIKVTPEGTAFKERVLLALEKLPSFIPYLYALLALLVLLSLTLLVRSLRAHHLTQVFFAVVSFTILLGGFLAYRALFPSLVLLV